MRPFGKGENVPLGQVPISSRDLTMGSGPLSIPRHFDDASVDPATLLERYRGSPPDREQILWEVQVQWIRLSGQCCAGEASGTRGAALHQP